MSERRRKILKIAGFVLIAAALGAIGYSAWNLISTEIATQQSLEEAERIIEEMNEYDLSLQGQASGASQDPDSPQGQEGASGGEDALMQDPDGTIDYPYEDYSLWTPDPSETGDPGGKAKPGGTADPNATPKPSAFSILVFESLGNRKVAVLEGATAEQLARGAAHHPRSSPPGAAGNCVIYGHRNTVFRSFGKLKAGAVIRLEVPGNVYKYVVTSTAVVEPGDPKIFQAYGDKVMTLVTCYPFNYVGAAPQRYIVVATLQQ